LFELLEETDNINFIAWINRFCLVKKKGTVVIVFLFLIRKVETVGDKLLSDDFKINLKSFFSIFLY